MLFSLKKILLSQNLVRWLFSTNHKDIGTLYFIFQVELGAFGRLVTGLLFNLGVVFCFTGGLTISECAGPDPTPGMGETVGSEEPKLPLITSSPVPELSGESSGWIERAYGDASASSSQLELPWEKRIEVPRTLRGKPFDSYLREHLVSNMTSHWDWYCTQYRNEIMGEFPKLASLDSPLFRSEATRYLVDSYGLNTVEGSRGLREMERAILSDMALTLLKAPTSTMTIIGHSYLCVVICDSSFRHEERKNSAAFSRVLGLIRHGKVPFLGSAFPTIFHSEFLSYYSLS